MAGGIEKPSSSGIKLRNLFIHRTMHVYDKIRIGSNKYNFEASTYDDWRSLLWGSMTYDEYNVDGDSNITISKW